MTHLFRLPALLIIGIFPNIASADMTHPLESDLGPASAFGLGSFQVTPWSSTDVAEVKNLFSPKVGREFWTFGSYGRHVNVCALLAADAVSLSDGRQALHIRVRSESGDETFLFPKGSEARYRGFEPNPRVGLYSLIDVKGWSRDGGETRLMAHYDVRSGKEINAFRLRRAQDGEAVELRCGQLPSGIEALLFRAAFEL